MSNTSPFHLFQEIFRKKDHRLSLWISQAEHLLNLKTRGKFCNYCTGEDIVYDVICGVLSGRIKWNYEKVSNISTFMHHQIRSRISNLTKKEIGRIDPVQVMKDGYYLIPDLVDAECLSGESLGSIYEKNDMAEVVGIVKEKLSRKDITAYFVLEEILSGYENRIAAEHLGITVREVENAKKRINTLIERLKE